MPAWRVFEAAEPELARRVRARFAAGRHKTIATLRADGSPRISGIECDFIGGDLRFGSMPGARKAADLRRDPRFALHSPTSHPADGQESCWPGEAKIAGRALLQAPLPRLPVSQAAAGQSYIADITEVVIIGLDPGATRLVLEWWTPQQGVRRVERE